MLSMLLMHLCIHVAMNILKVWIISTTLKVSFSLSFSLTPRIQEKTDLFLIFQMKCLKKSFTKCNNSVLEWNGIIQFCCMTSFTEIEMHRCCQVHKNSLLLLLNSILFHFMMTSQLVHSFIYGYMFARFLL